ncbi:hypothetical protein [Caldivirga maquilingensis]|uniref:Uncharacterized protein n=1 Tax=Caldivirga maquilingensis (strain ATCC 700844 / DSM 13496 / JCM 10307 / IC-167) TaxID=397948 RepID=A8M8Z4_CALMQ|nr:hypothetical protein [Caldivirga maquilingensis]ABW02213.1 conserved hypothetical protein [Caldivirga maquilingensis IC-167]
MVLVKPVLLPYRVPVNDLKGGVGTPYVIYDVRRDRYWLLFTGWSDPTGLKREGFVAPIDESLNVDLSQLKKILPSSFPEQVDYTNNAVRGIYNTARDEFYVTSTHGKDAYILVFDHDWNLKGYRKLIEGFSKDSGVPIKPTGAYGSIRDAIAVTPIGDSSAIGVFAIRSIDDLNTLKVEDWGELGRWGRGNDVIDFTLMPRLQVFVEVDSPNRWVLQTYIGPALDELNSISDLANMGILEASLMPLLGVEDSFTQIGHPHYTVMPDGKPKLLVASFRDTWSNRPDTKKEGYTHEIWAIYINDEVVFNPSSYGELRGVFNGTESKWYYLPKASRLMISVSGDAELNMKLDLHDDDVEVIQLSKGLNTVSNPATWVKVKANTRIKAVIKAVVG